MRVLKRGLFFAALVLSSPLAALADNMEEGAKLYAAKDYVKAKSTLEKAIAEKQNSWKAHLYLGHTLLTLGNFTHAKYQYQLCQRLTTNAAVLAQCTEGISRAEKYLEKRSNSSSSSSGSTSSSGSSASSSKSDASSAADSEKEPEPSPKEKRKKALMDEAREKMDKIRAEAKKQIEDEKNGSNQIFKYEDGSRGTDISDEREKEIMKEAEEKCKKIKDDAELRAR